MAMDIDYVAAMQAIKELEDLLSKQEHGEREEIADEIIYFLDQLKEKYEKI
jgi:hypothetical protein